MMISRERMRLQDNRDTRIEGVTFWFVAIIYMEIILRIFCLKNVVDVGIVYTALFALVMACFLRMLTSFLDEKKNRMMTGVMLFLISFVYIAQVTYQMFFGKFLALYSILIGGVEQITSTEMMGATIGAIKNGIPAILLLAVPFVFFCIWGKKTIKTEKMQWGMRALLLIGVISVFAWTILMVRIVPDKRAIYYNTFDIDKSIDSFGLIHTEMLDFKYNILHIGQQMELEQSTVVLKETFDEEIKKYAPNMMEIDFESLIASEEDETLQMLHKYFSTTEPTYQNEYTGMFEGYNLIVLTAEGFSPYVIDEELTPTLYKMANEGFQFKNFYTPIWGVSTSDGEYVGCTGLLPKSGVWSFYRSGENYMPFCLGNQFAKEGVKLRYAYHNHTYDYYNRDVSHPNMGYTYKGLGGGLTTEQIKKTWPESDLQMIEATVGDYVQSEEQFIAYYMTVSGHLEYNKNGNAMSKKNWDYVKDLNVSDTVKAYYACNIELDRALEKLFTVLEDAGIADKTVIALSADHYPYGLEVDDEEDTYKYFNEILGHEVETNFELYKSTFLLYSASMKEPIVVDKYASNVDIIPTLSNLFGLEYDSRLLVGRDIFAEEDPLVIFSNRSWINGRGRYNAVTLEFEAWEGKEFVTQEEEAKYISRISEKVERQFQISSLILTENYYAKAFEVED